MALRSAFLALLLLLPFAAGAQKAAGTETATATVEGAMEGGAGETQTSLSEPESEVSGAPAVTEDQPSAPADGAVASTSWWQDAMALLEAGGPVVMLLLGLSVMALTLVLVKLYQFRRARLWQRGPAREALALWHQGEADKALEVAGASANPTAQALARAVRGRRRELPDAAVREEVLRYGSDALFQLRRGFRPLEVIGSLAPLLGLLGTVLGMIEAFQQLEAAGNKVNPAILSGGIWEALLTTAVGLSVAIPVVAVLNGLERLVDHLAHDMDDLVTRVFTEDLSAAGEREAAPGPVPAEAAATGDRRTRRTAHAGG